jgi:hypothetical protein
MTPPVVIRPIFDAPYSMNQRLALRPAIIAMRALFGVGNDYSLVTARRCNPADVVRGLLCKPGHHPDLRRSP